MSLNIYFLNVGHGDCTIIDFPSGRLAIVDINNSRGLDTASKNDVAATYGVTLPPNPFAFALRPDTAFPHLHRVCYE